MGTPSRVRSRAGWMRGVKDRDGPGSREPLCLPGRARPARRIGRDTRWLPEELRCGVSIECGLVPRSYALFGVHPLDEDREERSEGDEFGRDPEQRTPDLVLA